MPVLVVALVKRPFGARALLRVQHRRDRFLIARPELGGGVLISASEDAELPLWFEAPALGDRGLGPVATPQISRWRSAQPEPQHPADRKPHRQVNLPEFPLPPHDTQGRASSHIIPCDPEAAASFGSL